MGAAEGAISVSPICRESSPLRKAYIAFREENARRRRRIKEEEEEGIHDAGQKRGAQG